MYFFLSFFRNKGLFGFVAPLVFLSGQAHADIAQYQGRWLVTPGSGPTCRAGSPFEVTVSGRSVSGIREGRIAQKGIMSGDGLMTFKGDSLGTLSGGLATITFRVKIDGNAGKGRFSPDYGFCQGSFVIRKLEAAPKVTKPVQRKETGTTATSAKPARQKTSKPMR